MPPCLQCDGSEVTNCATANADNKCLCDACKEDYFLSEDKKSCGLCADVTNCDTMNADSCKGCDACKPGYALSGDKKSCTQASQAGDGGGARLSGRLCCTASRAAVHGGAVQCTRTLGCRLVAVSRHSHHILSCAPPLHLQCTVTNCATYTPDTCTCTACAANYKLADNTCSVVRAVSEWAGRQGMGGRCPTEAASNAGRKRLRT